MQDYIGQHIDRYRITERLGVGGMAVVYKAYDTRLERHVALKLIRTDEIPPSQYEKLMKRFEREAKAQARFDHPHIVPVYDYGEMDGVPYLVMAHITGGTLKARTGIPVEWQQAIRWLIPIADALRYAHISDIVHRDIKPSNILFDTKDQPILTDFGIAKVLETTEATLTGTGLGVGTPEYMAPEQWQGKTSPATDQYALGVVLYELLTGQKPYTADTPVAVALLQITEPLRSPRALTPGIPEGVEELINQALAKAPEDRYENMAAFKRVLETQLIRGPAHAADSGTFNPPNKVPVPAEVEPLPGSEAETVDDLAPTPIESILVQKAANPQPTRKDFKGKTGLPVWVLWVGAAALMVLLLSGALVFFAIISRSNAPVTAAEPTEGVDAQVPAPLLAVIDVPETTIAETPLPSPTTTSTATRTPTMSPTPEPTLGIGSTLVNPVDGAVLMYVPEDEFLMGSEDQDARIGEKPEHTVYLDAYWIYQNHVTNVQFVAFVDDTGHKTTAEETGWSWVWNGSIWEQIDGAYWRAPEGPGSSIANRGDHPVVQMSWFDAVAYCQWAGGRLPTEAEWEKAARGTDGRKYPWGNSPLTGDKANHCDVNCPKDRPDTDHNDGYVRTSPVGSYPAGASPYGVLDMAGNVWEWVADWYEEDYYRRSPAENPTGPTSGEYRVRRGGSWYDSGWFLRVAYRYRDLPGSLSDNYGFRCLHSP